MKVGEYVRYIDVFNNTIKIRKINKIIPPDEFIKEEYYYFNDKEGTLKKNIIKSSPNIIDLIEEGDYVNGFPVLEIIQSKGKLVFITYRFNTSNFTKILDTDDIKSIVTKEMYSSVEYRVENN